METGTTLPEATLTLADGTPLATTSLTGQPTVIYFYPKADTPGCTQEAQDFSALADDFAAAGIAVIGVSKDPPAKQGKFAAKHGLTIRLASDETGDASDAFGVWGERQMYGRTYLGLERATFLFDRDGRLAREWRKVKVKGHAAEVLAAARQL